MSLLLANALLVLSVLFVRPAPDRAWPTRLLLHALLLAACLVVAALTSNAAWALCLVGLFASLLQGALQVRLGRRRPPDATGHPNDALWLVAGLPLVALSVRLVPPRALPPAPRDILTVALGILLTGLLGALAARSPIGRCGALLLAGDGLMLAACLLPGMDGLSLGCILLLQAGLLWTLIRATGAQLGTQPGAQLGDDPQATS